MVTLDTCTNLSVVCSHERVKITNGPGIEGNVRISTCGVDGHVSVLDWIGDRDPSLAQCMHERGVEECTLCFINEEGVVYPVIELRFGADAADGLIETCHGSMGSSSSIHIRNLSLEDMYSFPLLQNRMNEFVFLPKSRDL